MNLSDPQKNGRRAQLRAQIAINNCSIEELYQFRWMIDKRISYLQESNRKMREEHSKLTRSTCPITKLKPKEKSPRRPRKPKTKKDMLKELARLCGADTASAVEAMLKAKEKGA